MYRRFISLLVLSLAAGLIPAVSAPAVAAPLVPPPIAKDTGTIRGTVVDAASSAPVANACVTVYARITDPGSWPARDKVCTGADGKYEFILVPIVGVKLGVVAAGYPQTYWPRAADFVAGTGFTIVKDTVSLADFALTNATSSLSGLVTRPDGTPAPYATVSVFFAGQDERVAEFRTDAVGRFARTNIPPGSYQLLYWWNSPSRWYGGSEDRATATTITLTSGSPLQLNMPLLSVNNYDIRASLTGTVTSSGTPVAGATVEVNDSLGGTYATTTTDSSGNYSVPNLVSGDSYYVHITKPGYGEIWAPNFLYPAPTFIGNSSATVLSLNPGTIAGKLTDYDDGRPIGFRLRLYQYIEGSGYLFKGFMPLRFDGTFEVANLPPSQYVVGFLRYPLGRAQFYPAAPDQASATKLTVQSGQRIEIAEKLVPPSYIDATVTDSDTGAPVANACYSSTTCTSAEGRMLIGPLWTVTPASARSFTISAAPSYFALTQTVTLVRAEVVPAEFKLRAGGVVELRLPGKAGQPCINGFRAGLGQTVQSICANIVDGKVIAGPFERGETQFLVTSGEGTDVVATQWLSPTGGTGERAKAAVYNLQPRATKIIDKVDLAPGKDFVTTIRLRDGFSNYGYGCAEIGPVGAWCQASSDGATARVTVPNMGPYKWVMRYSSQGQASVWSGGAASQKSAVAQPSGGEVTLQPGGSVSGIVLPANGQLIPYDALAGDPVTALWWGYGELNTGPIALRVTSTDIDCWLYHSTIDGSTSPYFQVTAGQETSVPMTVQPGVNCLPGAPGLKAEAPRLPVPTSNPTSVPRVP